MYKRQEVKTSDPVQIGSYRGYAMSVEFSAWKQEYTLLLKGQDVYKRQAEILKPLYQGANGLGSVSAWYAEDGIHLSHGKSVRYDRSAQVISWESAAERIGELLESGQFASNEMCIRDRMTAMWWWKKRKKHLR